MNTIAAGAGAGAGAMKLLQKKKKVLMRRWLQVNNFALIGGGFTVEFGAAYLIWSLEARTVAFWVFLFGLACQGMGMMGQMGVATIKSDGTDSGEGSRNALFAYFGVMLITCLYSCWTLVILVLFHHEECLRWVGDTLDSAYKDLEDYSSRISGEAEIDRLSYNYIGSLYFVLMGFSGGTFVGAYASFEILGFRKIVKRFLQGINMFLVGMSSLMSIASSYVYKTKTFQVEEAQWFGGILVFLGVLLGITSGVGLYAVKYENGMLSRLYLFGLVSMLALFVTTIVVAFHYSDSIPEHFRQLYESRHTDPKWYSLFGDELTYDTVVAEAESNIMMVVACCSLVIDGLVLATLGEIWLSGHNKEDLLLSNLHEGRQPTVEQMQAAEEAASREAEVIKARREEVRMNALVTGEPAPMGGMPMGGMPMGGGGMAAAGGGMAAAGGAMGGMAQDAPMQPQMGGAATQFV